MERKRTAFTSKIRAVEDHVNVDATDYQIVPYITGGLARLVHLIKEDKVPQLAEFGHHTNEDGHFELKGSCLMGLRYNVKTILDSKGQSAVLVLAEISLNISALASGAMVVNFMTDLFRSNQLVVVKVLHTQFYRLGSQESHFLWRLAVSDPLNRSHTLRMLTTFTFDGHFCLVFEPLLPDPLNAVFQEYPSHKILPNIKKVGLRLLATIGFLHQQNLIHTDLKPDNILLKHENDLDSVHIVDFGNTIHYVHSDLSLYYQDFELQTPLYRAPEVMFGVPFGPEIDVWSLGCIFAELYLGKPLLLGNSTEEILKQMYELLGPFPGKLFRRGKYYQRLKKFTSNQDQEDASTKIFEHLQFDDFLFADLLAGMLRYNPDERLTASQAAQHPFFASYFPVAFLAPTANGERTYSTVPITPKAYKYSPKVDPGIKKGQPSSIDLLRIGTTELLPLSEQEETLILKPSPRYKQRGENLSLLDEPTQLFPSKIGTDTSDVTLLQKPGGSGHSDVSVVTNVITERKDRFSDNVKEKMSSLLKAIRQEQNIVETDLDNRHENSRMLAAGLTKGRNTNIIESVRPVPRYRAYREPSANEPAPSIPLFKTPEIVKRKTSTHSEGLKQKEQQKENNKSRENKEAVLDQKDDDLNTSQEKVSRGLYNHSERTKQQVNNKSKANKEALFAPKDVQLVKTSQEQISRESYSQNVFKGTEQEKMVKKDLEPCITTDERRKERLDQNYVNDQTMLVNRGRKLYNKSEERLTHFESPKQVKHDEQGIHRSKIHSGDRTYTVQNNESGYNLERSPAKTGKVPVFAGDLSKLNSDVLKPTKLKTTKASPRCANQSPVTDIKKEELDENVSRSPGYVPARTPYKLMNSKVTMNRPKGENSNWISSQGQHSHGQHLQGQSSQDQNFEGQSSQGQNSQGQTIQQYKNKSPASARIANVKMNYDHNDLDKQRKIIQESQTSGGQMKHKSPLKSSSEGRKRVYSDYLSDDEIIDVLSPVSYGSTRKRHKHATVTPDDEMIDVLSPVSFGSNHKRHKLAAATPGRQRYHNYEEYGEVEASQSNERMDNRHDDRMGRMGLSHTDSQRKSYSTVNVTNSGSPRKSSRGTDSGRNTECLNPGISNKHWKSRDSNNQCHDMDNSSNEEMEVEETNLEAESEMSKRENSRNRQESDESEDETYLPETNRTAYKLFPQRSGLSHKRSVQQGKQRQVKDALEGIQMPTPIHKFSQANNYDNVIDSPEIVYKTFKHQELQIKHKTGRPSSDYNDQFEKTGVKYVRRAPDTVNRDLPSVHKNITISRKGDNQAHRKESLVKHTKQIRSKLMMDNRKVPTETMTQAAQSYHDKFTFLGTPASDLKNEGGLADRIAKRRHKLKKPARKSLNFIQSEELSDESFDEEENSDIDYIDSSDINETFESASVTDFPEISQTREIVTKSRKSSSESYRQDDNRKYSGGTLDFERPLSAGYSEKVLKKQKVARQSNLNLNSNNNDRNQKTLKQAPSKFPGNGNFSNRQRNSRQTFKCDSTFVIDFESPLRHGQGK